MDHHIFILSFLFRAHNIARFLFHLICMIPNLILHQNTQYLNNVAYPDIRQQYSTMGYNYPKIDNTASPLYIDTQHPCKQFLLMKMLAVLITTLCVFSLVL